MLGATALDLVCGYIFPQPRRLGGCTQNSKLRYGSQALSYLIAGRGKAEMWGTSANVCHNPAGVGCLEHVAPSSVPASIGCQAAYRRIR